MGLIPSNRKLSVALLVILFALEGYSQGILKRGNKQEEQLQFPLETIYAEVDHNRLRELASKITFSISSGSGSYLFSHQIQNLAIYQSDTIGPLLLGPRIRWPFLSQAGTIPRPIFGYSGWGTKVFVKAIPNRMLPGEFITESDTTFSFTSRTRGIPLNINLFIKIKSFSVGGGAGLEIIQNSSFKQTTEGLKFNEFPFANNIIRPYPLAKGNVVTGSFYGYLGYKFLSYRKIDFRGDVQVGSFLPVRNFDVSAIKPGVLFNIGVNMNREWTDHINLFIRPSFEQKTYDLSIPDLSVSIRHKIQSLQFSAGLEYRIPALPRCYITACRTQIDHLHGNRQYRSRVHPFTHKQNPGYGENKVRVKPNKARTAKDGARPR